MSFFKALKEKAKEMKRFVDEQYALTASSFDDPIAQKTEWRPAKQGGSNFLTHSLIKIDENRLEFRTTAGAKLLYFAFLAVILSVLIIFLVASKSFSVGSILVLLMFISFIIFYFRKKSIVFDRKKRCFWIGRKPPRVRSQPATSKKVAFFEQIHALQLISETCDSSSQSSSGKRYYYKSYELNLVLKDGQRINVVDHGDKQALRKDTATLAKFLDKPIWDAI